MSREGSAVGRRFGFLSLVASLVLVVSGCGGAGAEPVTPESVAPAAAPADDGATEEATPSNAAQSSGVTASPRWQLDVIGLGDEPRRTLRYEPVVGQEFTSRAVMEMGTQIEIAGRGRAVPSVVTEMTLQNRVASVDAEGIRTEWSVEAFVLNAELEPSALEQTRTEMAWMADLQGWTLTSNRGQLLEEHTEFPEGVPESARAQLESVGSPGAVMFVPEQAVGEGAEWIVRARRLGWNGIEMLVSAHVTLESLEEQEWGLRYAVEVSAPPQQVESPNPQIQMTLESVDGGGEGTLRVRRDMHLESSMQNEVRTQMTVTQGAQSTPMNSTSQISGSIDSLNPAGEG